MKVVWGAYKKKGKRYAWRIPGDLAVSRGARFLARSAQGRYSALYAAKVEDDYSGQPPSGEVVRLLQPEEVASEIIGQQFLHPVKDSRGMRREKAAWQAAKLNIQPYLDKGFSDVQKLAELRLALQMNFPVDKYADPQKRLRWIRKARLQQLREPAPLAGYLPEGCSAEQVEQILLGLQDGVDVSVYACPALGWRVMRELRLALIAGMKADPLLKSPWREIRAARLA